MSCNEWNTFVEEVVQKKKKGASLGATNGQVKKPQKIAEVRIAEEKRVLTKDTELNRVLGGGIVPGSLVLVGGEPGIGKSTLMLQLALSSAKRVLYVSGEESEQQIKMRAERLETVSSSCYILTETATQNIFQQINEVCPELLVIDSIQTLHTASIDASPGSISQIKECTAELLRYAKEASVPVFIVGHITRMVILLVQRF